jgi:hypothetical protein
MLEIVKTLFEICLLRKGPEDLPSQNALMMSLLGLNLAVSIWLGSVIHDYQISILLSIVGVIFSFAFVKILLSKKPERFVQTFCAMLGTATLIDIVSIPIMYPLLSEELNKNSVVIFWMLALAIYFWFVVVCGFIFSRAISSTLGYGISISVGYVLVSYMIFELLLSGRAPS